MGSITHLSGSTNRTEPSWLCRKKAADYQRAALTATDLRIQLRYLHLARLWHEMAREAERKTNGSPCPRWGSGYHPDAASKAQQFFALSRQAEPEQSDDLEMLCRSIPRFFMAGDAPELIGRTKD
jgi:hypothetical protein